MITNHKKAFDVFLGGTTNNSNWRDLFIEKLKAIDSTLRSFNPVVDNWTEQSKAIEDMIKDTVEYHVYVITPAILGVYSIAEIMDSVFNFSNKTYICMLDQDVDKNGDILVYEPHMKKSLIATFALARKHGAIECTSLDELAIKIADDHMNTPHPRTLR